MKCKNPFDGLEIDIPQANNADGSFYQKALFEIGSAESQLIPSSKRIAILVKLVFDGYDLHKIVNDYLTEDDALDDDRRKLEIASVFRTYANKVFYKSKTDDWRKEVIDWLFGDDGRCASEQMRESIEAFIEVISDFLNDFRQQNAIKPNKVPIYLFRTNYYHGRTKTALVYNAFSLPDGFRRFGAHFYGFGALPSR